MSEELVSQARALRQQLLEQEERLRLALQAANLGTWEHVPGTRALHWDARAKQIFGLEPEDTLDFETFVAAIDPDDLPGVYSGIGKATDPAGNGRCTLQYRINTREGRERWVEAHGRCVFVDGVPQRINGTLLDITERKQAEETIRESVRRKDEFLAVLGHELRNPLAPIVSALELMDLEPAGKLSRQRTVIARQVQHLTRLVDDLLDVSRIAKGQIELSTGVTELSLVVARALDSATPLFDRQRRQLEVSVPEVGLLVDVDVPRMAQVLSNLLSNAVRYSDADGRVALVATRQGNEVLFTVTDDGIGIRREMLEQNFDLFVQEQQASDRALGGLGLGLAIVKSVVTRHGGSVSAQSDGLGRGSQFSIRLPIAEAQRAVGPTQAPSRAALRARPKAAF